MTNWMHSLDQCSRFSEFCVRLVRQERYKRQRKEIFVCSGFCVRLLRQERCQYRRKERFDCSGFCVRLLRQERCRRRRKEIRLQWVLRQTATSRVRKNFQAHKFEIERRIVSRHSDLKLGTFNYNSGNHYYSNPKIVI
ncbi:hypothetical protein AVEN_138522-1 [Araneus ventricosus]|uniref:Uncharacterized protein n=1 Tax=Araneus ventricosus TaxID=182803 RepID=A0A4Y2GIK8_ARAVE|nr:hypothetical protein AVEN_138522-1 [Araneus ventricosus]